ncbi:hypothetical protein GCM10020255_071790 [Rhodococcus baikonurensis]
MIMRTAMGAGVDRVAAPGQIDVAAVAVEKVVARAVQTSPADTDSVDALLAGVVVDDVEDDLDACRVECVDHDPELGDFAARSCRVSGMRGKYDAVEYPQ